MWSMHGLGRGHRGAGKGGEHSRPDAWVSMDSIQARSGVQEGGEASEDLGATVGIKHVRPDPDAAREGLVTREKIKGGRGPIAVMQSAEEGRCTLT